MAMRSVLIKGDVLISGVSSYGGIPLNVHVQVHHMHQYDLQVYHHPLQTVDFNSQSIMLTP